MVPFPGPTACQSTTKLQCIILQNRIILQKIITFPGKQHKISSEKYYKITIDLYTMIM
jgi:hypothetical protein